MSAETGPVRDVRNTRRTALQEWDQTASADRQKLRYQQLERRYQELYAVYEAVVSDREEERARAVQERERIEAECARLREELRLWEVGDSRLPPPAWLDLEGTLKKVRGAEAELSQRVLEVREQNEKLETELGKARRAEMKAELERVTLESRLRDVSERLLSYAVEVNAAKESLLSSIEALEGLEAPLAGEMKRAGSELSGGLMRDLKRELAVLTEVQRRLGDLSSEALPAE
jgi:predicted  nucleic acid-binding Zn-ribbon protein